jgi:hypothetical protein
MTINTALSRRPYEQRGKTGSWTEKVSRCRPSRAAKAKRRGHFARCARTPATSRWTTATATRVRCTSKITFIDGDKGILRYRGIPIEELAEKSTFIETAYLIIYGSLPNHAQLRRFSDLFTESPVSARGHEISFRGLSGGCASDGDPLGDDQRYELFR